MRAPTIARQYSVVRASVSCSHVNAAAPSSGPNSALRPPSSTITSASTERGIASVSGEMLPFENANSPPARPANAPANAKPRHCVARTSMPIAAARSGESRARAQREAERAAGERVQGEQRRDDDDAASA